MPKPNIPSAQLFLAAGLTKIPLLSFISAFFEPTAIAFEIFMIGALIGFVKVPWKNDLKLD